MLEEMLVINPDIYNIKITPCSAGFSLGYSALGIEHAISIATDYQDTSYSAVTHTSVVSPLDHLWGTLRGHQCTVTSSHFCTPYVP